MTLQVHSQSLLATHGRYAVSIAPDIIRRELDTEAYALRFLAGFEAALRQGRRDAQRLYVELLEMVGARDSALELALRALGASLEFARESVALRQQVQSMDDQARADYCLEAARKFYQGQGKRVVVLDDATNGGTDDRAL